MYIYVVYIHKKNKESAEENATTHINRLLNGR